MLSLGIKSAKNILKKATDNSLGVEQYWENAYSLLKKYHGFTTRLLAFMGIGDILAIVGKYSSPTLMHAGLLLFAAGALASLINYLYVKRTLDSLNRCVILYTDGVAPKRLHLYL